MTSVKAPDERFNDTVFLVEASDFELMCLWQKHNDKKDKWEQDTKGFMATVGHLNKRPVCVSLQWYKIDGYRVCFYNATSQVVDHVMIEDYFNKFFKRAGHHCDAQNFHNCLQHIEDLKKKRA